MTAPFGIELNAPISAEIVLNDLGGGKVAVRPPKPHPMFIEYYAQSHPEFGVHWLKGVGPAIEGDGYGGGVRGQLEKVSAQLESRYGKPRKVDIFDPDGIWTESKDWISSIDQNERTFFHIWEKGQSSALPDDIKMIFLGLLTHSLSDAAVIVEYASSNADAAETANDADLADLL